VSYVPALRFRSLTRIYDPLIRLTTREREFRAMLLAQAGLAAGQRVLDLGSGTGTLAVLALQAQSDLEVCGLDADREMVERATAKAREAGVSARFERGFSTVLPYPDASFDRVLSSLFFHHLSRESKRRTLVEVARVLKPGGELHVADWGRASDPVMAAMFVGVRLLDGFENTRDNAAGALPELFAEAGLGEAAERDSLRTAYGSLALYSAVRPT
jgi:ubiquinone/menaquinone biosynthesis C-methylase UbiE